MAMNPITGELYHKISPRSSPSLRMNSSPFHKVTKEVLSRDSIKSFLQPQGTIQHVTETDRFRTDFATEEREKREAVYQRRRLVHDLNRSQLEARAYDRSLSIEAVERQQAERTRARAAMILEQQKAHFKTAFDPITHEYHPTSKGNVLATHDILAQMRAERRRANINRRGNGTYNIISGVDRRATY